MIKTIRWSCVASVSVLAIVSVFQIARAEVSRTYDEFSGETTISVAPNFKNWNGVPRLYLNYSFKGQVPAKQPKMLFFSVIAPISTYAECGRGVTGVIADSERIPTADERYPQLARLGLPNIEPLGRTNPRMDRYVSLFARYQLEELRKIAIANKVVYQLCGNPDKIFQLSEPEKRDLKAYLKAITP